MRAVTPFSVTFSSPVVTGCESTVFSTLSCAASASPPLSAGGCSSSADHACAISSSPSRSSGVMRSASDTGTLKASVSAPPRSHFSSSTPSSPPRRSAMSAERASCAGAVTLTPHSVAAASESEHSIRPIRFFCIAFTSWDNPMCAHTPICPCSSLAFRLQFLLPRGMVRSAEKNSYSFA